MKLITGFEVTKFFPSTVCSALIAAALLALQPSDAVSATVDPEAVQAEVTDAPALQPATRNGYILLDAMTGDVLSEDNADALFIPASLSKIPTTLKALDALGTDERFETRLVADGDVVNGVLEGNISLVGSGDPSLMKADIKDLVMQLKASGVTRVAGRFTYDAGAVPTSSVIDRAQPAGTVYNPPVSGLNIDFNLRGSGDTRRVVRKPGKLAARMLRFYAHHEGIRMPPPESADSPALGTGKDIAVHKSAPVSQIIREMMRRSTNLTAESIGLLSARAGGNVPRSMNDAARMTTEWLKAEIDGIGGQGWRGFHLANHSGLSTKSRATPRQIAHILRHGYLRFGRTFSDLHYENKPGGYQAYDLRGKFGTLKFVRGYGGFLTVGGREMIFAIMSDDRRQRDRVDSGVGGLNSRGWMRKARQLEQSVLSEWVVDYWNGTPAETYVAGAEPDVTLPVTDTAGQDTSAQNLIVAVAEGTTTAPYTYIGATMEPVRSEGDPLPAHPVVAVASERVEEKMLISELAVFDAPVLTDDFAFEDGVVHIEPAVYAAPVAEVVYVGTPDETRQDEDVISLLEPESDGEIYASGVLSVSPVTVSLSAEQPVLVGHATQPVE